VGPHTGAEDLYTALPALHMPEFRLQVVLSTVMLISEKSTMGDVSKDLTWPHPVRERERERERDKENVEVGSKEDNTCYNYFESTN
jgi:hypothetical protein